MQERSEGGCACGAVRYALTGAPMIVNCCHCTDCRRESGAAFALNAMIERDRVEVLRGEPVLHTIPSASGKGQELARCPDCRVALWSHYAGLGRKAAFVRVGTLDDPATLPPDVHIFVASKLPWVVLGEGVPTSERHADPAAVWPEASRARYRALKAAA